MLQNVIVNMPEQITNISDREHFIEGQDVEIQCSYDNIDTTLDDYLEDLREANKLAESQLIE